MNAAPFVPAWTGAGYCVARVRPDGSQVVEVDCPDAATAEREAARLSWAHQARQESQAAFARAFTWQTMARNRRRARFFPEEDYP